jgi:hypothetical protein
MTMRPARSPQSPFDLLVGATIAGLTCRRAAPSRRLRHAVGGAAPAGAGVGPGAGRQDRRGPVIIVTGLTLAFGETAGGFRKLIQIVFGLSIAFAASSFFLSFFSFGGGALIA